MATGRDTTERSQWNSNISQSFQRVDKPETQGVEATSGEEERLWALVTVFVLGVLFDLRAKGVRYS